MIKVLINGCNGKMGQEVLNAINNNENFEVLDEYILTYIYDQNTNELLKNKLQVTTYVKADMKLYSKVDVISKENKNNYEFTEQVGDNITADIFTTTIKQIQQKQQQQNKTTT